MPRPTKAEIDAEILDCAARTFARHGFERASLQQIADALKYSKAGLLHHYPSKKALFEAVLEEYETRVKEQLRNVREVPAGIARDRALVESAVDFAFKWPGMAAFAQQLTREGAGEDPRFVRLGLELIAAMGIDFASPDMERMVRAFSALNGANFAARLAVTMHHQKEWRDHIIAAAMDALGYENHDPGRKR